MVPLHVDLYRILPADAVRLHQSGSLHARKKAVELRAPPPL